MNGHIAKDIDNFKMRIFVYLIILVILLSSVYYWYRLYYDMYIIRNGVESYLNREVYIINPIEPFKCSGIIEYKCISNDAELLFPVKAKMENVVLDIKLSHSKIGLKASAKGKEQNNPLLIKDLGIDFQSRLDSTKAFVRSNLSIKANSGLKDKSNILSTLTMDLLLKDIDFHYNNFVEISKLHSDMPIAYTPIGREFALSNLELNIHADNAAESLGLKDNTNPNRLTMDQAEAFLSVLKNSLDILRPAQINSDEIKNVDIMVQNLILGVDSIEKLLKGEYKDISMSLSIGSNLKNGDKFIEFNKLKEDNLISTDLLDIFSLIELAPKVYLTITGS